MWESTQKSSLFKTGARLPRWHSGNESACQCRRCKKYRFHLWGGNGNPPQYSCLKIPWTEEPGGLQLMASQRVGRDLARAHTRTHTHRDRETQREREGRNTHPKRKDMIVLPNEVKRQFNHLYGAVRLGLCSSLAKCLTSFPSSDLF